MFGSASDTRILDTSRLLVAPPVREGLVRLAVADNQISPWANAARAWELVNRFFPETVGEYGPGNLALDILPGFLRRVDDAGWCEIDWRTLDWLYEITMNEDWDPEEVADYGTDSEREMLACLWYVPARRYNWSTEQWWNLEEYPLLTIFKKLLDPAYNQRTGYPGVDAFYPSPGWVKVRCDAVVKSRGEPFDILSKLVNYVLREAGNPLLDGHSDSTYMAFWPRDLGYRWDSEEDMERLRREYAEAGPTWKRIEELCGYLDSDEVIEDFLEEFLHGETKGNKGARSASR
jgi:hypothetical protein